jgi:hypothetical protein
MIKIIFYTLIELPVTLLGFLMVAIALPWRKEYPDTTKPFSQYPGVWKLIRLPKLALWWDNEYDGLLGDKRGWYDNYCRETFKHPSSHPFCMWWWAAVRNPNNWFNRKVTSCDVSQCDIELLSGIEETPDEEHFGWQHLKATNRFTGSTYEYYGFSYKVSERYCLLGRFGWKIKLSHNGTAPEARENDRLKGNTLRVGLRTIDG